VSDNVMEVRLKADRHQEWVSRSSGVNSGEGHATCPCAVLTM